MPQSPSIPAGTRFATWATRRLSQRQFILLLSFVVGVATALAAFVLKWLIHTIESLLTYGFDATSANWLFLVYPIVGIYLTALFIKYVVRDDIGHGVTKILYAISRRQGHIRRHNCWSSVIASALTIGFGGSVGAESPIVLTGSAIGSDLGRIFKLDHKTLMLLIGCGATGAVAGIFKAPIAGLVFTLEVLMIDLTMASLLPLLITSVTAACVTYCLNGTEAVFAFQLHDPFAVERIPSSIVLGVFCGLIALYFTRAMNAFEQVFGRMKGLYRKLALGGTVLALLIYLFPPLYGEGYTTISLLLNGDSTQDWDRVLNNSFFYGHDEYLLLYLTLIVVFKVFATTATNGAGGCGGTFAPSLFLGCVSGFIFARLWNDLGLLGIHVPETNYALLGMAGLMSGVFHAPLTGVFLIAELTGGYDLLIPLIIVSVAAYLTINVFEPHSIYSMRLARQGQLLTHHTDRSVLTLMSLDSVIERSAPRLAPDMYLGQIVQLMANSRSSVFAVTDGKGTLQGIIRFNAIRKIAFRQELYRYYKAAQLMEPPACVLSSDAPMASVMQQFEDTNADVLPVVDGRNIFVGFITKEHLYSSYRKVIVDFSEE